MANCNQCDKATATIHVAESVRRDSEAEATWELQHLCDTCAQLLGVTQAKAPDSLGLLQIQAQHAPPVKDVSCAQCGLRLAEFRRTGRLGCPHCYETFRDQLQEVFEKAQGGRAAHTGRAPRMTNEEASRREDLASLQRKLRQAIESESYEEAARVRDRIRQLEASGEV